jgi:hypothetical protein
VGGVAPATNSHCYMVYEIVLRYPDRERVVVSETPLEPGRTVDLAGRTWMVLELVRPAEPPPRIRFICALKDERGTALGNRL